jgi:hypothetical protein
MLEEIKHEITELNTSAYVAPNKRSTVAIYKIQLGVCSE